MKAALSDARITLSITRLHMCHAPEILDVLGTHRTIYSPRRGKAKSNEKFYLSCAIDEVHRVRTGNKDQVAMRALVERTYFAVGMSATPIQNKLMVRFSAGTISVPSHILWQDLPWIAATLAVKGFGTPADSEAWRDIGRGIERARRRDRRSASESSNNEREGSVSAVSVLRAQVEAANAPVTEEQKEVIKSSAKLRKAMQDVVVRRTGSMKNPDGTTVLGLAAPIEHIILKPLYPEDQDFVDELANREAKEHNKVVSQVS
jgi:hypothetical protein